MKQWEANLSFLAIIIRIICAVQLAGLLMFLEWIFLFFIPFGLMVTALSGYCPVKQWIGRKKHV